MSYLFAATATIVDETAGTIVFTITRTEFALAETLYVSTTPDQGYSNNGDYQGLLNLPVAFAAGQASIDLSLRINDDNIMESSETFGIILQGKESDPANVFLAKTLFTIQDNDTVAGSSYGITTATPVVNENAGTITFTMSRTAATAAETVYVSTAPNAGYANAGDYQGVTDQQVAFAAGETTQTVTLRITDDLVVETDERFAIIVQKSTADPASTFLARTTFIIKDNEAPPPPASPVLLDTYPAAGITDIAQGNRDNDDSHAPGTARQWAYDFLAPLSTDVHAVQGGTVMAVRQDQTGTFRGYGNVVTVLCDGGFYVTYAHLSAFSCSVKTGDRIETGQVIARTGDSGSFDGTNLHPHLHVQFATVASKLLTNFSDRTTATLIADGSGDAESPAYFPKLTIHFDNRTDPDLSTDTDYFGTRGEDDFHGNAEANKVEGLAGDDSLRGMDGDDILRGGEGNDLLDGGLGADTMVGGAGDDTFMIDSTADVVTEAAASGTDTVQSVISFTLGSNLENLVLSGSAAISGHGNALNNVVTGNTAANTITGNGGDDVLSGGAGSDAVNGGSGNDILTGGAGRDWLTGGTGNDIFVFADITDTVATVPGSDVIYGFTIGADKIDFSAIDARSATGDIEDFVFVGTGFFTGDGQIRAVQWEGDTILRFNTGGTLAAEMVITLKSVNAASLTALDFIP